MRMLAFLLILSCSYQTGKAQSPAEKEMLAILDRQTESWNQGNLRQFMDGYWQDDSLMFIGKNGVTFGFENTLENYKRNYPDTAHMGKLAFSDIRLRNLSGEYYFVTGRWLLNRTAGQLTGYFSLLFRKIKGKWQIVSDHSS